MSPSSFGETTCVIRTESLSGPTVLPSATSAARRIVASWWSSALTSAGVASMRRWPTSSIKTGNVAESALTGAWRFPR